MTRERLMLGRAGEEAAAGYLQKKGMRVIQRNYRCRLGELDIVARDGPFLVFVEVRTVAGSAFGSARERVDRKKMIKIRQVATYYIQSGNVGNTPLRFDVVAVTMEPGGRVVEIDHIENAF
ncbi:MAG: YraN family protein [Firmicutes bacterium]|nr:YraN family protein [Bacillota bacterium]